MWVGTSRGLLRRRVTDTFERLSTGSVLTLFEDRDGDMWAGTTDGLIRFFERSVEVITPSADGSIGSFLSVEATADGTVWLGSEDGLYAVSGTAEARVTIDRFLPGVSVGALHKDTEGRLWISTPVGLGSFDDRRFSLLPGSHLESVFVIARDANGSLWSCHGTHGAPYVWRAGSQMPFFYGGGSETRYKACNYLFRDNEGRMWTGFADGTLARYDVDGGHTYYSEGARPSNLCAIHEDQKGVLWLATTAGLRRLRDDQFTTLTRANGLPSDFVTAIVEDHEGFLWLAVRSGVIRLAKAEVDKAALDPSYQVRYSYYDESDGVPSPVRCVTRPTAARRSDGTLWFLTGAGVVVIDPQRLPSSREVPPPRIERVVADGQTLSWPSEKLKLSPGTARLQIDYSVPSFSTASKLQFQFRLEGLDHDWLEAGPVRQASYTNLPAGNYRFHLRTKLGGIPQSTTHWDFSVEPFFYQTWWFYGICIVSVSVVLVASWELRVRALQRRVAGVVDERARIASELHDTILQSMAGMVLKLEGVAMEAAEATASQLRDLRREIECKIDEARDSIWNLRQAALENRTLSAALQEAARYVMGPYPGAFELRVIGDPRRYLPQVEEQLLRIGQEAIRNAVSHARFQNLCVELIYEAASLRLRVVDDGCGFDVSDQELAAGQHWGLRSIAERAARVGGQVRVSSSPGHGTEVEATVPFHL